MNASQSKIAPILYRSQDNSVYVVYVYSTNRDSFIHPTLINSIIAKVHILDITEIKKIGKGKIFIEATSSANTANRIMKNPIFAQHNLRAFIPAYKVLRTEVIQDVLVEIDIEIIRSNIEASRCKILDIQRFNRRINQNGKSEYIPSKTLSNLQVKDFLPKEVFIFKRQKIRPFLGLKSASLVIVSNMKCHSQNMQNMRTCDVSTAAAKNMLKTNLV